MKITNIRVLNNYKVKLINARLSAVNLRQDTVSEQGTRYPVVPTPPTPTRTFQEKFDIVFDYLMKRYEPGWSAADPAVGKAATMALLGVSSAVNPLILGGTVEASFNYTTGNMDEGWFDPLTHPKDFAAAVRTAYKRCERARSPKQAKHKFIHYNLNGIYCQDFLYQGGNAYYGYHPDFDWSPGNTLLPRQLYMGYTAGIDNGVCRQLLHSPYGNMTSPMNVYAGNWRRFPWLSDRYTGEAFIYDMYLLCRENTTLRDLLRDHTVVRDPNLGVIVGGSADAHLNTLYRGLCFPAGAYTKYPSYDDYGRTAGGFSADQVLVGSPWITFPNGITYSSWWGSGAERAGLCFNPETLVLFDGSTFPSDPQDISGLIPKPPMSDSVGLSFGYGQKLVNSLNQLSAEYGNTMEFIAYFGNLPYGTGIQMRVPFALYADPTVSGNAEYFRWRLDASVAHWKEKFLSPIDGFAHVDIDASAIIERTYHRWQPPGFTLWTNITQSGESYVENIPVGWARDQYNYTFGSSGPNPAKGVVLGTERFAQYMFKDDVGVYDPTRNDQRRFNGDTNPRHWCLDDDKPTDLMTSPQDMFLGQRKWGLTYSNSIWGMGVCGSSTLGEIHASCIVEEMTDTNKSVMSGFPFLYNTFTTVQDNGDIKWKRVPGTFYNGTSDGVPWVNDRRFRLFYLYPTCLALNFSILDQFHSGVSYYNIYNRTGWFDKTLGNILQQNMETNGVGTIVSDFPYPGRRTPVTPPQNFWTGNARTSEFELLYACMKGGITAGLDSLHFTQLYNELEPSGAEVPPERTGYYRSLDFNVYASAYSPIQDEPSNPAIVPLLKTQTSTYYRGNPIGGVCGSALAVNNTGGLPYDQYLEFKTVLEKLPLSRRTYMPIYWLLDGPPNQRRGEYFWKQTSDGTTYGTGITGKAYLSTDFGGTYQYGDTNPLRFATIWAYENRANAKESFSNFLKQAKAENHMFTTVNDDSEAGAPYGVASYYTDVIAGGSAAVDAFAISPATSYLEIPDARRLKAHVLDPRFRGVTNSVTGRSFAEEFEYIYNSIRNSFSLGNCGESAETILNSYFTNINDRFDYRLPYGGERDRQYQWYAYNSALYTFWHGDLKTKIIGGALDETTGFSNTRKYSSDVFATNAIEGRFATDLNGHHRVQEHMPGYGHQVHCYGQLSGGKRANGTSIGDGLITLYGYPPGATTNEEVRYGKLYGWHPVSEGGLTFSSSAYQAMIADVRRIRGILRTRPQAYQDGIRVWLCGGIEGSFAGWSGDVFLTQFYKGNTFAREYFLEEIYHLCLNGLDSFNVFNFNGTVSLVNEALVEWRTRSGNTHAAPCTNATATVGATVDRIDLYEAGTNMVISGGDIGVTGSRLWRMTAPPGKIRFTKTSTTQTTLPDRIPIPANSRGVWLEAPASYGIPEYQSE